MPSGYIFLKLFVTLSLLVGVIDMLHGLIFGRKDFLKIGLSMIVAGLIAMGVTVLFYNEHLHFLH
jgi:hypothetical protein